jgi:hypothetical protein
MTPHFSERTVWVREKSDRGDKTKFCQRMAEGELGCRVISMVIHHLSTFFEESVQKNLKKNSS